MALAITCPHCEENPVETVRDVWFLQGFLLFARWGSNSYVGCYGCTRNKALGSFALSSILGWWCFPWGLGTPLVMLQNLVVLAAPGGRSALAKVLLRQGLDIDELELDADGRSPGQRQLVDGILVILHDMVWADGSADEREIAAGVRVAGQMLGDKVDPDQVRAVLSSPSSPGTLDASVFGSDSRLMLLRAAGEIAAADEVIEDGERDALRALGAELGLPDDLVEAFLAGLAPSEEHETMRQLAAEMLGISADTPLADVQGAYRKLLMDAASSDGDEEAKAARLEELGWAYQTLLGAAVAPSAA